MGDGPVNRYCSRCTSSTRFADNMDAALSAVARLRPDGDLHVLPKGGQKTHQALAGEVRKPPIEARRYLRLIDAHQRRRRHLGQTLPRCLIQN